MYGRTAKLHEAVLRELYLETKETTQSARWACQGWNERTGWHHHAGHPLAGQGIHSRAINAALVEKAAKIIAILGDQVADAQQVDRPWSPVTSEPRITGASIMDLGIKGLRVIVTAGAAGIGREVARAFLGEGALVQICDVDRRALAELAGSDPKVLESTELKKLSPTTYTSPAGTVTRLIFIWWRRRALTEPPVHGVNQPIPVFITWMNESPPRNATRLISVSPSWLTITTSPRCTGRLTALTRTTCKLW